MKMKAHSVPLALWAEQRQPWRIGIMASNEASAA